MKRVVITGMGALTPIGNTVDDFWASLINGVSGAAPITKFALEDGTPRFNPFFSPKMIVDIASGIISIKYGLRGINFTTVSACATSNTALIDAFNYIRWDKADMIISGGSEAPINESSVGGFNAAKALSTFNENPAIASRPFDIHRDGFVIG